MGNEQSSAGHGLADSQGSLKDCIIDDDPILNDDHWSLHHAQLHSTPMSVFISKDNRKGSLDDLAKVNSFKKKCFLFKKRKVKSVIICVDYYFCYFFSRI